MRQLLRPDEKENKRIYVLCNDFISFRKIRASVISNVTHWFLNKGKLQEDISHFE